MATHRSTVRRRYSCRPGWSAAGAGARRPQWSPLDLEDRRALERPSSRVSFVPNLPPTVPAVGARRDYRARAASAGRRSTGTWRDRPPGSFHRRNVQFRKKRGLSVGKTKRGKGTKIMAIADAHGLPIAVCIESASPHEVTLVDQTIDATFLKHAPDRLIGDRAYDSDPLDARLLRERGVELIAPHRGNRKRPATQDGRVLRRYCRRWKIERLFAWLHHFRRIVTRYEYYPLNFLGFVQLGCLVILSRRF